jgi:hypothetical protein
MSEADDAPHDSRRALGIANPGEVVNERQRILSADVGIKRAGCRQILISSRHRQLKAPTLLGLFLL